jgi:hypothetical protein
VIRRTRSSSEEEGENLYAGPVHPGLVAVLVSEYDAAIRFFVDLLGFELVEDSPALTNDGRRNGGSLSGRRVQRQACCWRSLTETTRLRQSVSTLVGGWDSSCTWRISTSRTHGWLLLAFSS